jgi:hypothetical protein
VHSKPPKVKEPPVPIIRSTVLKEPPGPEIRAELLRFKELASGHLTEIRIQRAAGSGYFKKAPKSRQFWAFQKVPRRDGFHGIMGKKPDGF